MRHLTKVLLTAGLAVAFVSLTLAQQPGRRGGGFQLNETALLMNKSVQEELKVTDPQKEQLTKIQDAYRAATKDLERTDREGRAKAGEARDKATADVMKDLKPEQKKRLLQIFVQVNTAPPMIMGRPGFSNPLVVFANEDVQKELKLDDKQKDMIKKLVEDHDKDVKEIRDNTPKDDKDKQKEAREKISTMTKETAEKVQASFTDDQKKLWKDLPGEKFEIKFDFGPGKDKKKDTE